MRALRIIAASVRDLGLAATLDQLPLLLLSPFTLRRLKRRKLRELSRDGFDALHGTDTAAMLIGRELGPGVTRGGHLVVPYETTSEASIRLPLDSLSIDLERFVFVDLGCGKGKPIMVASTYPFRGLIGVDISPACIAAARRNIARHGPERIDPARIRLLVGDAADFSFPLEPLVLYLYNPFPGAVLERIMANLEKSLGDQPREVVIIYLNPQALPAVTRSGSFERVPTIADRMPMAVPHAPAYEKAVMFVTRSSAGAATMGRRAGRGGGGCRMTEQAV